MRAVTGYAVLSEPISLRRAAGVLFNFAKAGTGARPDVAAYLRRACKSFDELVQFHWEIGASRKITGGDTQDEEREEKKRKKKRKEEEGEGLEDDGDGIPTRIAREAEKNPRGRLDGEIKGTSLGGGIEQVENSGVVGTEEDWDRIRKKKKKVMRAEEEEEEEKGSLERNSNDTVETSKGRRKKKEKPTKMNQEAKYIGRHSDVDWRDGDRKKRKHSQVVEEGVGLDGQRERCKRYERRKMEMED